MAKAIKQTKAIEQAKAIEQNEISPESLNSVLIHHEPVELCKILKFENLVLSGGEAKQVIANGMVYVNGKVETQKRKKIFAGDIVKFNGYTMKIINNKCSKSIF